LSELVTVAQNLSTPPSFIESLGGDHLSVVAEVKRRSPSKGDLAVISEPEVLVKSYVEGGAAAVSVLTDTEFFHGSESDLRTVRSYFPELAILRKDFTVSELDVIDAKLMGASAILLIVAILSDEELRSFSRLARELSLVSLFETHDVSEVDRAYACDATVIGVNQRNLTTFAVDTERALEMVGELPTDVVKIAESGISRFDQCELLASAGFDAVLVGEMLVRSDDPARDIAAMSSLPCRPAVNEDQHVH
jgi:indole-3-glycerol phosphate synthase